MAGKVNKESVEQSKHFCMIPWIHMHLWPDSTAHACCISDSQKPLGRYEGDFNALVNSKALKQMRKNMLMDEPSEVCKRCYELEKNDIYSLRKTVNRNYLKYFSEVEQTSQDGSGVHFNMRYFDVRFSNICNFKCRSCGPSLSSTWAKEHNKIYPGSWKGNPVLDIAKKDKLMEELLPRLLNIEQAYFAGGEPLVTDEIYTILDYWIEHNHTNVRIDVTTNFSILNYRNKSILDYLNKFPHISVSASLDAAGSRGEYLRKGTIWDKIVENRKKMIEHCPQVQFQITPTISAFNVWHFPDFHLEWIKEGLIAPDNLRINILTHPDYMSFNIIHPDKRKPVIEKWEKALDHLKSLLSADYPYFNNTFDGYNSIIKALRENPYDNLSKEFFKRNKLIDFFRDENLYDVFPELKELL